MSQYVVWYDSSETGAPVLNNAAGSLIGVLDACLINGFNLKAITSLVVAGGVATATCNSHGYSGIYSKDIAIAGCDTVALNGRKQLTYVDTNTFKFDATGVADQTATGTITAKRDPLGWTKQFEGTNKAIYKRSDVTATSIMLRVVDTAATPANAYEARVFMVESATDIDTYTGQGPTQAQRADGQYWNKGENTATAKQWSLVGDGKFFFLTTQSALVVLPTTSGNAASHCFGDFKSLKSGDAYNTMIHGSMSTSNGAANGNAIIGGCFGFVSANPAQCCVARAYTQVGDSVGINFVGVTAYQSGGSSLPVYPSPIDSGMLIFPTTILAETNTTYKHPARGFLMGLCQLLGADPMGHYSIIDPVVSLPGRKVLLLNWYTGNGRCTVGLDLTGPWA